MAHSVLKFERLALRAKAAAADYRIDALGDALRVDETIPYADLPGFPTITVPGHTGATREPTVNPLPAIS